MQGCVAPLADRSPPAAQSQNTVDIFVTRHDWHTGVVLPVESLGTLRELVPTLDSTRYVEVGWGDEGFYRANEISVWLALRALFWPTQSVVHIVSLPTEPTRYFPHSLVFKIPVTEIGLKELLAYIDASVTRDSQGEPILLGPGIYGASRFYRSAGTYYFLHTCNHWTATALRRTGFPITPAYAFTANNVAYQIRRSLP